MPSDKAGGQAVFAQRRRRDVGQTTERRHGSVARVIDTEKGIELIVEPGLRPRGHDHRGVVVGYRLPRLVECRAPVSDLPYPMPDYPTERGEPGLAINATGTGLRCHEPVDVGRTQGSFRNRGQRCEGRLEREGVDALDQVGELVLEREVFDDPDEPLNTILAVD